MKKQLVRHIIFVGILFYYFVSCRPAGRGIYAVYKRDNMPQSYILKYYQYGMKFSNSENDTLVYTGLQNISQKITKQQYLTEYPEIIYFADTLFSAGLYDYGSDEIQLFQKHFKEYELEEYNLYSYLLIPSIHGMPLLSVNEPSFYNVPTPLSKSTPPILIGYSSVFIADFVFGPYQFHSMVFQYASDSLTHIAAYSAPKLLLERDSSLLECQPCFKLSLNSVGNLLQHIYLDKQGIAAFRYNNQIWKRIRN